MTQTLTYQQMGTADRGQAHALFAQTMGYVMSDFQRLRTNTDVAAAPLLAASIFLDVRNVFLFFLQIRREGYTSRSGSTTRRPWPGT
jgi:hypothetical protein